MCFLSVIATKRLTAVASISNMTYFVLSGTLNRNSIIQFNNTKCSLMPAKIDSSH